MFSDRSPHWLHPQRLRLLAALFGRPAPDPAASSILCVVAAPDSLVALDLSATLPQTQIVPLHGGTDPAAPLSGLTGPFAYIVIHNVFAGYERHRQQALLAAAARLLAPSGLLAVDYPAYPGAHFRAMVWEALRSYTAPLSSTAARIQTARGLLAALAANLPCAPERADRRDVYALVVQAEQRHVAALDDDGVLELLAGAPVFPRYLHEVVADAQQVGLDYLGDARPTWNVPGPAARNALDHPTAWQGRLDYEHYSDLVHGTLARQTVLCHAEAAPHAALSLASLGPFHMMPAVDPEPASVLRLLAHYKAATLAVQPAANERGLLYELIAAYEAGQIALALDGAHHDIHSLHRH